MSEPMSPTVYTTLEEAQANPRHGKTKSGEVNEWSIFRITAPDGTAYFTWSGSGGVALTQVVMSLGWSAALATSKRATDVRSALAAMTEEQRAALLAEFAPETKRGRKRGE